MVCLHWVRFPHTVRCQNPDATWLAAAVKGAREGGQGGEQGSASLAGAADWQIQGQAPPPGQIMGTESMDGQSWRS